MIGSVGPGWLRGTGGFRLHSCSGNGSAFRFRFKAQLNRLFHRHFWRRTRAHGSRVLRRGRFGAGYGRRLVAFIHRLIDFAEHLVDRRLLSFQQLR